MQKNYFATDWYLLTILRVIHGRNLELKGVLAVRVAVEKMGESKISKVAGTKGKRKILQH